MLTADRRDRDDWNTMLKSKPRGMILTPEREYIRQRGTHHTHRRHMIRLFVIHDAYEPMHITPRDDPDARSESITKTTGTYYTHGGHIIRLFVIHDAYEFNAYWKLLNCHGHRCRVTNKLFYNCNSKQTMRGVILSLVTSGASSTTINYYYCCTCPAV